MAASLAVSVLSLLLLVPNVTSNPSVLSSTSLQRLMPFVGNGFVATHPIVGSEGGVPGAYRGNSIFMSGVYNGVSKPKSQWGTDKLQSHRASIPDFVTNVSTTCSGGATLKSYQLDMRRAVLSKSWSACGSALQVEEQHLAHQKRRNLLLHVLNATNHGNDTVSLSLVQATGPLCGVWGCDVHLEAVACADGRRCVNGTILQSELPTQPLISLAMASTEVPSASLQLRPGESTVLVFFRALSSTLDAAQPLAAATTALQAAETTPTEQLLAEHEGAWAEIWEEGRVEVEGDSALAAAVNGSLYNILSSVRQDWPFGLSPGGLASNGYHGDPRSRLTSLT